MEKNTMNEIENKMKRDPEGTLRLIKSAIKLAKCWVPHKLVFILREDEVVALELDEAIEIWNKVFPNKKIAA